MINHQKNKVSDVGTVRTVSHDRTASNGVLESARRVEQVSREINEFLIAQFEVLERELRVRHSERTTREPSAIDAHELAQQRAQWEREKRTTIEQLESDRACLTEAWERLEAEQRKLLADRSACERAQSVPVTTAAAGYGGVAAQTVPPHALAAAQVAPAPQLVPDQAASEDLEKAVRESVLMQFQQLKNDVRSHARRRNSR